jgi:hypothetical protein
MEASEQEIRDPSLVVGTIPFPGKGLIRGIASSSDGTIYVLRGTCVYSMTGSNTFEIFAGSTEQRGNADGHRLNQALFNTPNGIFAASSDIYICDNVLSIIKVISADEVTTFSGTAETHGWKDGPRSEALFNGPSSAVLFRETLFVSDYRNNCIRIISSDGIVSSIGGMAGHDDGPFSSATFDQPSGLCISPTNTILVADSGSRRVRSIDVDEQSVTTIAGGGAAREDGPGPKAGFGTLSGITASPATGEIYLVDFSYNRMRCIDSTGTVSTLCGSTRGERDGSLATALLLCPDFCCMSPNGTLYWTEYDSPKLRHIKGLSPPIITVDPANFTGFEKLLDGFESDLDIRSAYDGTVARMHTYVLKMSNPKLKTDFIKEKLSSLELSGATIRAFLRVVYGAKRPKGKPYDLAITYSGICFLMQILEFESKWIDWCKCRFYDQLLALEVESVFSLVVHFADDRMAHSLLYPVISARLKSCKHADIVEHRKMLFPLAQKDLDLYTMLLFQATGAAPNPGKPHDVSADALRSSMRWKLKQLASQLKWVDPFVPGSIPSASPRNSLNSPSPRSSAASPSPRSAASSFSPGSPASILAASASSPPTGLSPLSSSQGGPSLSASHTKELSLSSAGASWASSKSPPTVRSPTAESLLQVQHHHHSSSNFASSSASSSYHHSTSSSPSIRAPPVMRSNSDLDAHLAPNFTIHIAGNPQHIRVHDWVLFSRWRYFRRLILSGLEESRTKSLVLHADFPPGLLLHLLTFIYSGSLPTASEFSFETSLYLLEHAPEFDFVNSEREALSIFKPLISYCRSIVFQPITVSNVLSKMRFIAQYGSQKEFKDALRFIGTHLESVARTPTYHKDVSALPADVCREILLLK